MYRSKRIILMAPQHPTSALMSSHRCMHARTHPHACTHTYTFTHTYMHMHVCTHALMPTHMHAYTCICMEALNKNRAMQKRGHDRSAVHDAEILWLCIWVGKGMNVFSWVNEQCLWRGLWTMQASLLLVRSVCVMGVEEVLEIRRGNKSSVC